jgi:class 3 adenylate cyclase
LVVVGDLIGEGSAQEQSVVGETPNLASRLQSLAEPDTVVIAASTRRLVGDLFEYRDLGAVDRRLLPKPGAPQAIPVGPAVGGWQDDMTAIGALPLSSLLTWEAL